jgi:hypothetical protein
MVDYVFQTTKIAVLKTKSLRGVAIHEIIVLTGSAIILSIYSLMGCLIALLIGLSHFVIDYGKMKIARFFKYSISQYIIDQLLHLLVIFTLAYLFGSTVPQPLVNISYIGDMNYTIIIIFVATVVSKTILIDIYGHELGERGFFIKHERLFDGLIVLMVAISFLNVYAGIITLAISAGVYLFTGIKYFKYTKVQLAYKALIYLVIASVFRFLLNL